MTTNPMNYIRTYTPSDAKRVVDVFSSGLMPLKDMFALEDEVFFAIKHCTDCYSAESVPCATCRDGMRVMGRDEERLVYSSMTSTEYIEATHAIERYRTKKAAQAAQAAQEAQKRKRGERR